MDGQPEPGPSDGGAAEAGNNGGAAAAQVNPLMTHLKPP